jgi:predicted nuclease with TOPRIM domain
MSEPRQFWLLETPGGQTLFNEDPHIKQTEEVWTTHAIEYKAYQSLKAENERLYKSLKAENERLYKSLKAENERLYKTLDKIDDHIRKLRVVGILSMPDMIASLKIISDSLYPVTNDTKTERKKSISFNAEDGESDNS